MKKIFIVPALAVLFLGFASGCGSDGGSQCSDCIKSCRSVCKSDDQQCLGLVSCAADCSPTDLECFRDCGARFPSSPDAGKVENCIQVACDDQCTAEVEADENDTKYNECQLWQTFCQLAERCDYVEGVVIFDGADGQVVYETAQECATQIFTDCTTTVEQSCVDIVQDPANIVCGEFGYEIPVQCRGYIF